MRDLLFVPSCANVCPKYIIFNHSGPGNAGFCVLIDNHFILKCLIKEENRHGNSLLEHIQEKWEPVSLDVHKNNKLEHFRDSMNNGESLARLMHELSGFLDGTFGTWGAVASVSPRLSWDLVIRV